MKHWCCRHNFVVEIALYRWCRRHHRPLGLIFFSRHDVTKMWCNKDLWDLKIFSSAGMTSPKCVADLWDLEIFSSAGMTSPKCGEMKTFETLNIFFYRHDVIKMWCIKTFGTWNIFFYRHDVTKIWCNKDLWDLEYFLLQA